MGNVSCGNCSSDKHTLYQQDCDSNCGDVSSVNSFIKSNTLYQCHDSSTFREMDVDVEKGDVSNGYGYMKIHTVYQYNSLK